MQQFIYSVVRTFPFWAIPLGAAMISSTWARRAQKMSGGRRTLLLILGLSLIVASGFFLYFQGHERAVPLVHEMLYTPGAF